MKQAGMPAVPGLDLPISALSGAVPSATLAALNDYRAA